MKILTYPDQFLKNSAEAVTDFTEEFRNITEQMIQDMYVYSGVGLASIQVGVKKSVFVLDISR